MPHLHMESEKYGTLNLNAVFEFGEGVQATAGAVGLGLPPVSVQWRESAGNGAVFRGKRVLARDIDLPLYVKTADRAALKETVSQMALMLSDEVTLRFIEEDEEVSWFTKVHRVGGGTYNYGEDTLGENELFTVLTFRAGDPFWTSSQVAQHIIRPSSGKGLLNGSLSSLNLSSSQALGDITLYNPGDADAYPTWVVTGPGTNLVVELDGVGFTWNGTLTAGQSLTIDTYTGRVTRETGANAYADMAAAPRLWTIPPGEVTANVALSGTSSASQITCTYRPRKWLVI